MIGPSISVPVHLWRGELRVQGLLLRKPLVTTAQALVGAGIFVLAVLRVHDALTSSGQLRTLNIAVLTFSLGMLVAANVTLLGERTGTLPWQLQRWAAGLPLRKTQVSELIVVFSILRSALLTLTLLSAVAIGALTASHSSTSVVEIACAAVVLPLLPVALGLQWARRRGTSVSLAFTIVPLGIGVTAASVPLPLTVGWLDAALRLVALPGMTLAGRADPVEAAILLAAWTALALALMRPAALSLREGSVGRGFGSSTWRLPRAPASSNPNLLALDIALHRVGITDLLEILFLGAVSCSVVALQSFARESAFGVIAMAAAFSGAAATATIAGYIHMRSTIRTDPQTESWIETLPLSASTLSVARHGVCTGGALLAVVPVMGLALLKSADPGAVTLAVWTGFSALALTGWFALYLSMRGWKRQLAGYALFAWYAVRTISGAAVLGVWNRPLLLATLFATDLAIAAAGQRVGAAAGARVQGQ
jgi:hypothetical protein